ncbi:hypothetical protein Tco_0580302 [Tanacetum coccineum]
MSKLPPCVAITPVLSTEEPDNSLSMRDEHLDAIPEMESNKVIKSSVEDLVPIPSESEDTSIIYSPKIDSLLEEFAGELALIAPILPGIVKADLDPKGDIRFIENLMHDNSFPRPLETLKDDSETVINSNNDYSSSDDYSYEDINYVDASPPNSELISLEEVKDFDPEDVEINTDILLTIKDDILREKLLNINLLIARIEALKDNPTASSDYMTKSPCTSPNFFLEETDTFDHSLTKSEIFCFNLEEKSSGNPTSYSDLSLTNYEASFCDSEPDSGDFTMDSFVIKSPIPVEDGDSFLEKFETTPELKTFKFDIEEKNSGSTTNHADISLPDLKCFYFKNKPDPAELTSIIDPGIRENFSSTTNINLPFEDDQSPLFAYVVWIFLPFLTYLVTPPYLLSSENEDTNFDPGISIYHSFMLSVSHRSGTFMKFNVYSNHLNESLMEILSSICSPMDQ